MIVLVLTLMRVLFRTSSECSFVQVRVIQINPQTNAFEEAFTFSHSYPATKLQFLPSPATSSPDLLATSGTIFNFQILSLSTPILLGDYLRIWEVRDNKQAKMKAMLAAVRDFLFSFSHCLTHICPTLQTKHSDYCAPLTSFDWNEIDTNVIGTASVDTTCTVWDLASGL